MTSMIRFCSKEDGHHISNERDKEVWWLWDENGN